MKIQNTTDTNKRIRLTALDSAMVNIDNSVGAIAKDGKDVLLCLAPIPKANEMEFTTLAGTIDYVGSQGDQILLSDGTIVEVTYTDETFTFDVPEGKHVVKLAESVDRSNYVSVGGEALVELHNFPTLSTVTKFNFATYYFNGVPNLTKVPEFFPSNIIDMNCMFWGASAFNQDISGWDVSNVIDMNGMFYYAAAFNQPLNSWNVSNVTDMNSMFISAIAFDQPLNNWDTSNVTDMNSMFSSASAFNQPLNNWNVSNATDMNSMFGSAEAFDQPLGNWDTSNVTDMNSMFYGATSFNQDIGSWNVSNVNYMGNMFEAATSFNQDLSQWCVSNITSLPDGFDDRATNWTLPRPVWGTCPRGEDQVTIPSNEVHFTTTEGSAEYVGNQGDQILLSDGTIVEVTDTGYMTFDVPAGKHRVKLVEAIDRINHVSVRGEALVEIHNFPTLTSVNSFDMLSSPNLVKVPTTLPSNLTSIGYMFSGATSFDQDISSWNVSNVTDMSYMFDGATAFNQDISGWDVSNVTDMNDMFRNAKAFNQPLNNWKVSNVGWMGHMFYGAASFDQDIGSWDVSNVIHMAYMFQDATAFNQDLSGWCVSNITSEPTDFSTDSPLTIEHKPVWGTCPIR